MRMPILTEVLHKQEIDIFLIQGVTILIWPDKRIERVHKCGTKENCHGHAHQRDNISNQTHAVAVNAVNSRVLPRRLNSECICAVCVMQQTGQRIILLCETHILANFIDYNNDHRGYFICVLKIPTLLGIWTSTYRKTSHRLRFIRCVGNSPSQNRI